MSVTRGTNSNVVIVRPLTMPSPRDLTHLLAPSEPDSVAAQDILNKLNTFIVNKQQLEEKQNHLLTSQLSLTSLGSKIIDLNNLIFGLGSR